ncbi:MAG TPA: hypothetical protein VLS25_11950, partial [Dehalococcoidia bacterium]|nr:hypothetical protein [Dehalococcoidia bacterium]
MRVAEHGTKERRAPTRLPAFNVLAQFESMEEAREAIETLGQAGIDAGEISLSGTPMPETAERGYTGEMDAGVLRRGFLRSIVSAAFGGLAGALMTVPLAVMLAPLLANSDAGAGAVAVAALVGGLSGVWIAWANLLPAPTERWAGEGWGLTFAGSAPGTPFVGVH